MQPDDEPHEIVNPYAATAHPPELPPNLAEDDFEPQAFRPFQTIWLHPRRTVRRIVALEPELHVVLLVCLAGVGRTLDRASMRNAGEALSVQAILAIACVFGPIGGLIGLWVGSHLIRLAGTMIGGQGERTQIKTAIAWASVPSVFALALWVPQILLFGSDLFTEATPRLDSQPLLWIPFIAISIAEVVLGVWSFVLLCNTVAEVQQFYSAWRGFGNLILAGLLLVVPMMIMIAFLVVLL